MSQWRVFLILRREFAIFFVRWIEETEDRDPQNMKRQIQYRSASNLYGYATLHGGGETLKKSTQGTGTCPFSDDSLLWTIVLQIKQVPLFARFGRGDIGKDDNRFHLCQALRLVGKIGDLQLQRAVLLDNTALWKQPAQEYDYLTFL